MAGEGDCPSAPSRAPGCGVHWSEAKALARKKRTDQAQNLARKEQGPVIDSGQGPQRETESELERQA